MDDLEQSTLLENYEIERYRTHPVAALMPLLRSGIFHATSLASYEAIETDGFIRPNDGTRPSHYERTKTSFGYKNGYISLFDLESTTEEYCVYILDTWSHFVYYDYKPVTILLGLNRQALGDKLIPSGTAQLPEFYIPYVEAWYPEPIPLEFIEQRIIVIYDETTRVVEYAQFSSDQLGEILSVFKSPAKEDSSK